VNNLHFSFVKDSLVPASCSEKEQIPMSDNTFRIITCMWEAQWPLLYAFYVMVHN
jgi:hypothetical protein